MTTGETSAQRFLASLHRSEADTDFLPGFYRRFMGMSEEVREKFRHTDVDRQVHVLGRSLRLCAAASEGEREGMDELSMRAMTHNHTHLDIRPELYDLWVEALVAAAARSDPEWNEDVEAAWRDVLGFVVRFMTSQY